MILRTVPSSHQHGFHKSRFRPVDLVSLKTVVAIHDTAMYVRSVNWRRLAVNGRKDQTWWGFSGFGKPKTSSVARLRRSRRPTDLHVDRMGAGKLLSPAHQNFHSSTTGANCAHLRCSRRNHKPRSCLCHILNQTFWLCFTPVTAP